MARRSLDPLRMNSVEMLRQQIRNIEMLGDASFGEFRWDVVSHYRRFERDQESIATALVTKHVSADDRARQRVDEILAMLDHVHDPFITAS
jgi:hypothetical protein